MARYRTDSRLQRTAQFLWEQIIKKRDEEDSMKLYEETKEYKLYQGSMLNMTEVIEKESIDSIITDPPYGLTSITKRFGKENAKYVI